MRNRITAEVKLEGAGEGAGQGIQRILDEPEFFQKIFDLIPLQILVKSARPEDFGTFLLQNLASEQLLGFGRGEMLGKSDADFFTKEQVEFFRQHDDAVLASGQPMFIPLEEVSSRTLGLRLLQTSKVPIYGRNGQPLALMVVSQDITDRVADERTLSSTLSDLREERDLIRSLIDSLPIFVFAKYADSARRGQYILWNRALERFYGVAASDVVGRIGRDVLPESAVSQFEQEDDEVIRTRRTVRRIGKNEKNSLGEHRIVDSIKTPVFGPGGNLFAIVGCAEDVTERRSAELDHQRMETLVSNINRRIPGAIYQMRATLSGSRTFIYISEGIEEILGLGVPEILRDADSLYDLIHPDDRALLREVEDRALRTLMPFVHEFRCYDTAGRVRWLMANSAPVIEDGDVVLWSGHVSDITDRKSFEMELIRTRDEAERASRAKDDFLAMMSHEIRTPLNGILGFAQILSHSVLPKDQRCHVETILESGSSLLAILNDILDFSKIESDVFQLCEEPVNVLALVASVHGAYTGLAQSKGVEFLFEQVEVLAEPMICDPVRYRQILSNLVSNALKFTQSGLVKMELKMDLSADGDRCDVQVAVSDTGIGIASSDFGRLFRPFEQGDPRLARKFPGTGLGLAIVKRLVDSMDGAIRVTSEPGIGSTFEVSISMKVASAPMEDSTAPTVSESSDVDVSGLQVLVVEDNAINRRLASLMLERIGVSAVLAESGEAALERAAGCVFDLILMDIQMPGMDGYQAGSAIRKVAHHAETPIVALTAHAMSEDRKRSEENGFAGHLVKPFKIDELRQLLVDVASKLDRSK